MWHIAYHSVDKSDMRPDMWLHPYVTVRLEVRLIDRQRYCDLKLTAIGKFSTG